MFWNTIKRVPLPDCRACGLAALWTSKGAPCREDILIGQGGKKVLIITEPKSMYIRDYPYLEHMPLFEEINQRLPSGMSAIQDLWFTPALKCSPASSKDGVLQAPTGIYSKTACCRPAMVKLIKDIKPSIIICMGPHALDILYGKRGINGLGCTTLMGFFVPDYELGAWVTALPDVAEVALTNQKKQNNDGILDTAWNNAFHTALLQANMPLPDQVDYDKKVVVLTEYSDIMDQFSYVFRTKPKWFDFDYEANCIKPHHPEAKLYSVSWMTDDDYAYSAPFGGWNHFTDSNLKNLYGIFSKIMQCEDIQKSCHNLPMEDSWTSVHVGTNVQGWGWDSLVSQHMLNVTRGTKSLKFQVFARYGFGPYEDKVSPYLTSSKESRINTIHKAPMRMILHYGGLDSVFTRKLRQDQMRQLQVGRRVVNTVRDCFQEIYLPGAKTMSDMSVNGLRIDEEYFKTLDAKIEAEQQAIENKILKDNAVVQCAAAMQTPFSVASNDHVRKLIFEQMGYTADLYTDKGQESVTAEVLEDLDIPIAQDIVKWRKLSKIKGTYISQYLFEIDNGIMRPAFNLGRARSGRTSSSSPNMHNVPKHDEYSKKIIRGGIFPHWGYRMGEVDYASQEVRIFTCHTKDPVLIDYLTHGGDMHRDEACHVYEIAPEQAKFIRNPMKMGWVFALLYGSYYKSCAIKMWEEIVLRLHLFDSSKPDMKGISVMEHMRNKGVRTLEDFIEWCKRKETEFWEKFNVTREYQNSTIATYRRKGYIETLFGFRRGGVLSKNKLINTPTQGSGCQTLIWSCNEIRKQALKEKWKSMLVGQVHDSAVGNFMDDEIQHVLTSVEYIMTQKIRERFDFLIVPFEVEVELGPVDGPWSSLKSWHKKDGIWQPCAA